MTTLSVAFTAGRYHATPWGMHVNEGGIDWPPAPWRLLRALLAVGFAKHGWKEPPLVVRSLIERLATTLPSYRLPFGGVAHTRHYLPVDGGKTTKVLDTFLRFADDTPLLITWPVDIPDDEATCMADLAAGLAYLGRAESWCQARMVGDSSIDASWARPCAEGGQIQPGWEQVTLLAPVATGDYAAFRQAQMPSGVDGRKPGKVATKVAEAFPTDLIACLLTDTATLRGHGWSQPPGSRKALYLRPADALRPAVGVARRAPRPTNNKVDAMLLALASDTEHGQLRPLMARCLPQMETLHDTAVRCLDESSRHSPVLTGRDPQTGLPLRGHRHAHWLPLDLDGDGRIDHVLVHAREGLDLAAQDAIARIEQTWGKDIPRNVVNLVGSGTTELFARQVRDRFGRPSGLLARSAVWTSLSPFIAPRFRKVQGKNALAQQVITECVGRDLPTPQVEVLPRAEMVRRDFLTFVRRRRVGHPQPPDSAPWALRLTFPEPISGPLTLGYGSHFGLGLFAAEP